METIIVSDEVGLEKPDPRIFQMALHYLAAEPAETIFVGDHPINDVIGAAAAGMTSVWVKGAVPWPEDREEPGFQIDSLSQLLTLLGVEDSREPPGVNVQI